jgi:cytochrome c7-like protein
MRIPVSVLKSIVASLLSGSLAAASIMLVGAPRAEEAAPAGAHGMLPTTEIPYYAEWASSPHAKRGAEPFNHWNKEGNIPTQCARCHSTPGFLDYLGADGTAAGVVDRPAPVGTVITCVACHNGRTATLTSVTFPSGLKVDNQGADARCMACHQGVESTGTVTRATAGIADDSVGPKLQFINVHYAAAGATLFGSMARVGYEYPGKTYAGRYQHRAPYNHCTGCHETHTVEVRVKDCAACHREVTDKASLHRIRVSTIDRDGNGNATEGLAQEVEHLRERLLAAIMDYAKTVANKAIVYNADVYPYFFVDTNSNGVADADETRVPNRYNAWTPRLLRAAYNYQFVRKDPGAFAHNPIYTLQLLHDSLTNLGEKVRVDLGKAQRP